MNEFYEDLVKFQEKYPMCYIEAWTPEDFAFMKSKIDKTEKYELNWNTWNFVAEKLYETFDANQGTNWHKVFHIVEGSLCTHN
jgi:hypothetical protein